LTTSSSARLVALQAARFEAILKTARDGIISIDPDGVITLFNHAAEEIFGYRAAEVEGASISMLMPEPYRSEHDSYIRRYRETGEARAIGRIRKVEGRRRSGETFPLELSVSEVQVGGETLYTAVIRDVSGRERDEAELERLRRLSLQRQRLADIGALTAKIVHDLANPLAALSMVGQGILRRVERSPDMAIETVRPQAERLVATAVRLDALLGEFKDFARVQRLEFQNVEVGSLLQTLEDFWRPEAERQHIVLDVCKPAEEILLRADPERLHRVFDNLVKNSLEAIDRGPGRVAVHAELLPDDRVRLEFSDSGPGVPAGVDVFALFETTKPTGTGLGLPICRQIIAAHGGDIAVAGGESGGAVFQVDLPVHGPSLA